jgi:polyribonucleotide nucleotidyltransferase
MEKEIKAPRANPKDSHPKFGVVPIDRAAVGKVIGPLGATIKGIQAESGED